MKSSKIFVMTSFLSKHKRPAALFALAMGWILLFPIWNASMVKFPLDIKVSLNPPGVIEEKIKIVNPEKYALQFQFYRSAPLDQLARLIGGCVAYQVCYEGITIPLHWSITDIGSDKVIIDQLAQSNGMGGGISTDSVFRHIDDLQLPVGSYLFKAEILNAVPEFKQLSPHLVMFVPGKDGTTWQTGFCCLDMLVLTPISYIIAIISSYPLVYGAVRSLLRRDASQHQC